MKTCPSCNKEFDDNVFVCPDCEVELIPVETVEDWVTVYSTEDTLEAEMLKSNLNGAGINVVILNEKDTSFPGYGDLSVIKVNVTPKDFEEAKQIIEDINKRAE
jgi:hypothetical protein